MMGSMKKADMNYRIKTLHTLKWGGLGIFVESYSYNQEIQKLTRERDELQVQQEELLKKDDAIVEQVGKSLERLEFEEIIQYSLLKKNLH